MGYESTIYAMNSMNVLAGSSAVYANQLAWGANPGYAAANFGFNIISGAARNEWAHNYYRHTGSMAGHYMNSIYSSNPFGVYSGIGVMPFTPLGVGVMPFGGFYTPPFAGSYGMGFGGGFAPSMFYNYAMCC